MRYIADLDKLDPVVLTKLVDMQGTDFMERLRIMLIEARINIIEEVKSTDKTERAIGALCLIDDILHLTEKDFLRAEFERRREEMRSRTNH